LDDGEVQPVRKPHLKKQASFATLIAMLGLGIIGSASPADATCPMPYSHPAKAAKLQASLVQMFVSCNNPGGNVSNSATETGTTPTCYPAETFHQHDGTPPASAWTWGPHASGSVSLKAAKNALTGPPDYAQNTDPDAADLLISIKMTDIHNVAGLADTTTGTGGHGHVQIALRMTIIDREESHVMTLVDLPFAFEIPAFDGRISTKTSLTVLLDRLERPALPACSTVELLSLWVLDPDGIRFAEIGTFLP
jgi:hypothetical protein